jgi:hypothetical protein
MFVLKFCFRVLYKMGKKKAALKRADPEQTPASAHDAALAERDERGACPGSEASAQGAERVRALDEKLSVHGELTNVAQDAEDSEEGKKSRPTEDEAAAAAMQEEHAAVTKKEEAAAPKKKEEGEKSAAANGRGRRRRGSGTEKGRGGEISGGEQAEGDAGAAAALSRATSNARMFGSSRMFQRPRKFNQEPKYMSPGPKFGQRKKAEEEAAKKEAVTAQKQAEEAAVKEQEEAAAKKKKEEEEAAAKEKEAEEVSPASPEPAEMTSTVLRRGYCRGQVATMDGTGTKHDAAQEAGAKHGDRGSEGAPDTGWLVHSWASTPFSASPHTRPAHTGPEGRVFFETVGAGAYCAGGNLGKVGTGDERHAFRAGRRSARGTVTGRPDRNSEEEMALSVRQMGALLPMPQRCEHNAQSDIQVRGTHAEMTVCTGTHAEMTVCALFLVLLGVSLHFYRCCRT